jgi:uncharacterized protein YegL
MGAALMMVADELRRLPDRGLPPVLVLISDGQPTDDFQTGLRAILGQPWGQKAVRMSIAIGEDADLEILQEFIANPEIKPLRANSPEALVRYIKWVSTAVLKSASAPASQNTQQANTLTTNVPVPAPPVDSDQENITAIDVW